MSSPCWRFIAQLQASCQNCTNKRIETERRAALSMNGNQATNILNLKRGGTTIGAQTMGLPPEIFFGKTP